MRKGQRSKVEGRRKDKNRDKNKDKIFLLVLLFFLSPLTFDLSPSSAEVTPQSHYRRTQEILELMKINALEEALQKIDPSLAGAVRELDAEPKKIFAHLYNEKGVRLANDQKVSEALPYLELAVELNPQEKVYQKNLSQILAGIGQQEYLSGDFGEAEEHLNQALTYDSQNSMAMILLSDLYYFSQKIPKAEAMLNEAQKIVPQSAQIQQKLKKIQEDKQLEEDLKLTETEIFDIKFEKTSRAYNITDLKQTLRKAYREIGQNLNYFPKRTLVVILYPEEDYRGLREIPEWSSGAYDGKIRIPIPDSIQTNRLKQIIWHEYTHAVVRDLTAGECPIWLNEGLAEYHGNKYAPFDWRPLREAYLKEQLLSLKQLAEGFHQLSDADQIRMAYAQSYLVVNFIIDRWGMYKIRHLLETSQKNSSIEELIRNQLNIKLEQFEKEWLRYLKRKL